MLTSLLYLQHQSPVRVAVIICLLQTIALADEDLTFGKKWPALKDCLTHSDETGDWGFHVNSVTDAYHGYEVYRFLEDGSYTSTCVVPFEWSNRYLRKRKTISVVKTTGKWSLGERPLRQPELKLFHTTTSEPFLVLTLDRETALVDPPFPEGWDKKVTTKGRQMWILDRKESYVNRLAFVLAEDSTTLEGEHPYFKRIRRATKFTSAFHIEWTHPEGD